MIGLNADNNLITTFLLIIILSRRIKTIKVIINLLALRAELLSSYYQVIINLLSAYSTLF